MNETIIRQQFPSLNRHHNGRPLIFLDGPAGTQVPYPVMEAVTRYYENSSANTHGHFITSQETDEVMDAVREKAAAFLGAEGPHTISLGANMTTLNYSLSHAIGRVLQPGDEIVITQLDHEANRAPWLALRDLGITVREVRLQEDGTLDYADLEEKVNEDTRLVAMGYASNIFGTVNDVAFARRLTHRYGAWLLLDAVHYAPHLPMDVRSTGCDFLLCSAYKFYGPHVGILYCKPGLLDRLPTDRLRTAPQQAPYSIETGTPNHAAMAGTAAAIDFIAGFGEGESYRTKIQDAMERIRQHESACFTLLYDQLQQIPGITTYGPPAGKAHRAPTVSFTLEGMSATEVCKQLAKRNICAWDGHFYAVRATEVLGLAEQGGVTRMGMAIYTTEDEIRQTVEALGGLVRS